MGNGGSLPSILALHHDAVKTQERRRLERDSQGGDLHYMIVCSRGALSRVVLADVAGHGEVVSSVADRLRTRKHVDTWPQSILLTQQDFLMDHGRLA